MPRIFVSYRRLDSGTHAGRIADRLKAVFGDDHVFKDSYNIKPGADFRGAIREEVGKADVVLALIGPDWLDILEQRRNDPNDWVKLEIETGLQRDRAIVIPLLLAGAFIPPVDRLPDSLKELAYKNAFSLRMDAPYFRRDMDELIAFLQSLDGENPPTQPPPTGSTQSGSNNVQQNIGTMTGGTVIGKQTNNNGGGGGNRVVILVAVIGAAATIIAAAIGILPSLLSSPSPTETPTIAATDTPTDSPTETAEPPTSAPTDTSEPATVTSAPSVTPPPPTATTPAAVIPGSLSVTIFRDDDSFTLLAPAGSDLTGLTYRANDEDHRLEDYAGFRGLPFGSLPQTACFRLIRAGGTRPTPLECQGSGVLLLTQQIANADVFWRDGSAGLDRTISLYVGDALAGFCAAGQSRCEITS